MLDIVIRFLIIFLIIVFIVVGLKLIKVLDQTTKSIKDVNRKLEKLDPTFEMIEKGSETISNIRYNVSKKVNHIFGRKVESEDDFDE